MAAKFVQWIISADTQKMIGGYGTDKFGQPLFYPSAKPASSAAPSGNVALTVTGLVEKELKLTSDAVKASVSSRPRSSIPRRASRTMKASR